MTTAAPRPVRPGLVLALLIAGVAAQDAGLRGRAVGFVTDAAGAHVADAEVMLLSWPLPPRTDLGEADRVTVRSDAQGRFFAAVLHGRAYTGWARWRTADGAIHRSEALEGVMPGPPRGLREGAPQQLRRVRIEGMDAWRTRAPLRVCAMTAAENPERVELALDGEGQAELPDLPGDWCTVLVRDRNGVLLCANREGRLRDAAPLVVTMPPPRRVHLTVRGAGGAVLPDAVVYQANCFNAGAYDPRTPPDRLGATGKDGTLLIDLPANNPVASETDPRQFLLASAAGHSRTMFACKVGDSDGETAVEVSMNASADLRGRLVDAAGQPVRDGVVLLPDCWTELAGSPNASFGVHPMPEPMGKDGTFAFAGLHPRSGFRLLALVAPDRARELGLRVQPGIAVAPLLWLAVGEPPHASPVDLGELRLDRLAVARIEVRDHDGSPAVGARIRVTGAGSYTPPLECLTDRAGRLQFPLPTGQVRIGAIRRGGGVATLLVRVPPAEGDPALDPMVITLSRTVVVRGTVVHAATGAPIAGAVVRPWDRPEGGDRELADLAYWSHEPSRPTGADGRYEVTLPFGGVQSRIRAHVQNGERWLRSPETTVDLGGSVQDVTLAVEPPEAK